MLDLILLISLSQKFQTKENLALTDLSTNDFIIIYIKCTAEPFSILAIDTMLASDNPLRFRKIPFRCNKNHHN